MLTKILDKKLGSSIFTGRQIISMLMPLIMDSFFVFGIGVLTTAMISSSSQESVAAISLVLLLDTDGMCHQQCHFCRWYRCGCNV